MRSFQIRMSVVSGVSVLLLAALSLPQAQAELVFDNQSVQGQAEGDRANLRQVLSTQGAPVTQGIPVVAQVPVTPVFIPTQGRVQTQPSFSNATSSTHPAVSEDLLSLTKAELLRRQRVRAELKNEDILQTRLEELRLRDEERRTGQLLGDEQGASEANAMWTELPQTEVVSATLVDDPGRDPAERQALLASAVSSQTAAAQAAAEAGGGTLISLTPRGGLSDMVSAAGYDIQSRFTAGLGVAVEVSDNLTFDAGYGYSEYGVRMASTNPYVQQVQAYQTGSYGYGVYPYGGNGGFYGQAGNTETLVMKQNVLDAGLKMHLLNRDAKLRPFLGGGAAYAKSFVNYDQRILDFMRQSQWQVPGTQDYEVSSFLGYLSTGFDLKLSKSVSVGAVFKYYAVLTARENQKLNNLAFYGAGQQGYNPYGVNPYYGVNSYGGAGGGVDSDKQALGGTLARAGFYSILAGVTFTF